MMSIFNRDFYARSALLVARELLGATLVRRIDGQRVSGTIIETEAYTGLDDSASHARMGRTPHNLPMWETPGHAFVYLTYGLHWLFNVTCEPVDHPAAVLIRALEPLEGQSIMAANRPGHPPRDWMRGPGRITAALAITGLFNRADLTMDTGEIWIEPGQAIPDEQVSSGPRFGLGRHVADPWLSMPWRWWVSGNRFVSRT
jgi:DNA-3-methyladenine glycosylase